MNSKIIYHNLVNSRKHLREKWKPGSGLQRHRIIPKHSGGTYDPPNCTYLTKREHVIAHYLLWRIHRNPLDLGAMKMISGHLSPLQRSILGKWCADNKIGFHNEKWDDCRDEWRQNGRETQRIEKIGPYHNEELHRKVCALGGKVGSKMQMENNIGIHTKDSTKRSEWASLGAKAHKGKCCMYLPGATSFKRVKSGDIDKYLNNGYVFGSPLSPRKGKRGSTHRRKKVTDGKQIFISLKEAGEAYNTSSSSICHWLKDTRSKYSNWVYVS